MARPSLAHLITPAKVFKLALRGHSQAGVAASLGVSRACLQDYLKNDPAIRQAWEKGVAQDVCEVVGAVKKMATDKNNAIAAIFYLKNRDPDNWKDKHDVQHSGNLEVSLSPMFQSNCIDSQNSCIIEGESEQVDDEPS